MKNNGIVKHVTRVGITVDDIYKSDFQKKNTLTCQVRQVVTIAATYPSAKIANEFQGNLFKIEEFAGMDSETHTSTQNRVAWLNIPTNMKKEDVEAAIVLQPAACIYSITSSQPIISVDQQYGIEKGFTTKNTIAIRQILRYPEGHETAGEIVLDSNGKPQYRENFFWENHKEDIDLRTSDPVDTFMPEGVSIEEMTDEGEVAATFVADVPKVG